ncbi:MAG: 2-oxo acid dehydrogenase subunit E2 [Actinomycetota bacterium]|nr:2-oxo acid dehydrogenase subunit E2 [Actinomycetota bacterium]
MPYDFKLPDVGEGTEEAELVRWLVEVGQEVDEDQPVAEIQTDKVQTELYAPVAGTVKELLAEEGDMIQVQSVFITFETGAEGEIHAKSDGGPLVLASDNGDAAEASGVQANGATAESGTGRRKKIRATPAVRRVARELGVNLELVEGSGSGGRVMEGDVQAFVEADGEAEGTATAAAPANAPEESADGTRKAPERVPLRGIRRSMFTNMARSASTVAHSFGLEEVDVTELVALRRQMKAVAEEKGARLTYLPFAVKAAVTALKEYPYLNASVDDKEQQVVLHNRYDIGIAVDTPQGLLVPVLRDADEKSILGLSRKILDLAERGREGKLGMEDFKGGTFTVTNVGSIGGIAAMPVVDHPQVAILGLHRIQRKPAVRGEEEEIVVRDMMNMSLSFDHRVIDGATCFNFLARVAGLLEQPNLLFMEMT